MVCLGHCLFFSLLCVVAVGVIKKIHVIVICIFGSLDQLSADVGPSCWISASSPIFKQQKHIFYM